MPVIDHGILYPGLHLPPLLWQTYHRWISIEGSLDPGAPVQGIVSEDDEEALEELLLHDLVPEPDNTVEPCELQQVLGIGWQKIQLQLITSSHH